MTIWWLALVLAAIGSAGIAFIWLAVRINQVSHQSKKDPFDSYGEAAEKDVEHIFNDEFREELRNRGRLHFEKIIGENAMFLQQDLRLTTSQLNDYMKSEITRKLQEEFDKYEQSIMDAKQLAIDSIEKTNEAINEQRQMLGQRLQAEVAEEKERLMQRFVENMAEIVEYYVTTALGDQFDMKTQLPFIIRRMEESKKDIVEDIKL